MSSRRRQKLIEEERSIEERSGKEDPRKKDLGKNNQGKDVHEAKDQEKKNQIRNYPEKYDIILVEMEKGRRRRSISKRW